MTRNPVYEDEVPEELIDGKWFPLSHQTINHGLISGNLYCIFSDYLKGSHWEPFRRLALVLSEKDEFIPDFMLVYGKERIKEDAIYGAPALVVEVLSPSTAKRDRTDKKNAYEAAGVKEYWIVNPADFSIEVYLLKDGAYDLDEIYSIYPEAELKKMTEEEKAAIPKSFRCSLFPDFEIELEDVFWRLL